MRKPLYLPIRAFNNCRGSTKPLKHKIKKFVVVSLAILSLSSGVHAANLIYNGGFETGDFTGWTQFETADGELTRVSPLPTVYFDNFLGGGYISFAAFQVQQTSSASFREGGGIYQNFVSPGGLTTFNVNIYAHQPFNFTKPDPGIFGLYVDGFLVAERDFRSQYGQIGPMVIFSSTLQGHLALSPGVHELRVLMRSSAFDDGSAPFQYLGKISAVTVPEPSIFVLLTLGIGMGFVVRWRGKSILG
jgi:hypothetical protein